MFFTRLGLEQATDAWVARYKATRFPAGQLLADLCCGIGGDLMALSERGPTRGVDRDPVAAICAGGFRSSIATSILRQQQFERITNVVGGMTAWMNAKLDVATE